MGSKPIDFEFEGYGQRIIHCSIVKAAAPSDRLALVLPGYRHPVDRPDLWYPAQMLIDRGIDVVRVLSLYADTDITARSIEEGEQWLAADARALLEAALRQGGYDRLVCVGRSLGAFSMACLLDHVELASPCFIWLSPMLEMSKIEESIVAHKPASLFVVGGADKNIKPADLERLRRATGGRVLVIENANHDLEVSGDIEMTLWAMGRLIEGVQEFLDDHL